MRSFRLILLLAACLSWPPLPASAADGRIELMAESCAACHGSGGVSLGPSVPSLAGQPKDYFVRAMRRFKNGERPTAIMDRLARGYSDTEIEGMGAYFAAKKPAPQFGPIDAALTKRGLKVSYDKCRTCHVDGKLWKQFHQYRTYDKNCNKSCHLDYGAENNEEVPLIAGQWQPYLEEQMAEFISGRRPMSDRKAKALKSLSRDDVKAVSQFFAEIKELQR